MKLSDIKHWVTWLCEYCCFVEVEDLEVKAGDALTCSHCDSTYYVEENE